MVMIEQGVSRSSCHHHSDEFFVVDVSVSIDVGLSDHFINLFVSQLFSQICHHVAQFSGRDESVSISVKHLECFNEFFFSVGILHFSINETDNTWPWGREIRGNRWYRYRQHLPSWSYLGAQLQWGFDREISWQYRVPGWKGRYLGGDGAVSVFVKESESFLELSNLFFVELVSHGKPINLK